MRSRFSPTVVDSMYLVPRLARKFGPHHIVVRTFLSNIRITTFFAGESEIKIIDPSQASEVQGFGCEVEFIPATEQEP